MASYSVSEDEIKIFIGNLQLENIALKRDNKSLADTLKTALEQLATKEEEVAQLKKTNALKVEMAERSE